MPVGGIVEKLLAAHRAGIREVIIPQDNRDSLTEIPEEIAGEMKIHLVDQLKDALDIALLVR
jgi:ATP-dependent Lon protease